LVSLDSLLFSVAGFHARIAAPVDIESFPSVNHAPFASIKASFVLELLVSNRLQQAFKGGIPTSYWTFLLGTGIFLLGIGTLLLGIGMFLLGIGTLLLGIGMFLLGMGALLLGN
jgi:hypothetical protein